MEEQKNPNHTDRIASAKFDEGNYRLLSGSEVLLTL